MFLTPELEQYYQEDFKLVLLYKADSFWQLDKLVSPYLCGINELEGVQTLYSRYFNGDEMEEPVSYLRLAYRETFKKKIQAVCIELIRELDGKEAEITIREEPPQANKVYEHAEAPLGCLNNPNYFQLHHYYLAIHSTDLEYHARFWSLLTDKLREMTEA